MKKLILVVCLHLVACSSEPSENNANNEPNNANNINNANNQNNSNNANNATNNETNNATNNETNNGHGFVLYDQPDVSALACSEIDSERVDLCLGRADCSYRDGGCADIEANPDEQNFGGEFDRRTAGEFLFDGEPVLTRTSFFRDGRTLVGVWDFGDETFGARGFLGAQGDLALTIFDETGSATYLAFGQVSEQGGELAVTAVGLLRELDDPRMGQSGLLNPDDGFRPVGPEMMLATPLGAQFNGFAFARLDGTIYDAALNGSFANDNVTIAEAPFASVDPTSLRYNATTERLWFRSETPRFTFIGSFRSTEVVGVIVEDAWSDTDEIPDPKETDPAMIIGTFEVRLML